MVPSRLHILILPIAIWMFFNPTFVVTARRRYTCDHARRHRILKEDTFVKLGGISPKRLGFDTRAKCSKEDKEPRSEGERLTGEPAKHLNNDRVLRVCDLYGNMFVVFFDEVMGVRKVRPALYLQDFLGLYDNSGSFRLDRAPFNLAAEDMFVLLGGSTTSLLFDENEDLCDTSCVRGLADV
ncbi:hypothetical protein RJ639_015703 [Escallonia herrerae]|uniref:Uncharacterized protein n=1 Tax=Escallonia herrerae TaxID=1293975 RepID=A0AA88VEM8_9ASTE|nr:hypothetical protein RJ639_015703 [Escallonia herrerae]